LKVEKKTVKRKSVGRDW